MKTLNYTVKVNGNIWARFMWYTDAKTYAANEIATIRARGDYEGVFIAVYDEEIGEVLWHDHKPCTQPLKAS